MSKGQGKKSVIGSKISQSFYDLTSSQRLRNWKSKLQPTPTAPAPNRNKSVIRRSRDSDDPPPEKGASEAVPISSETKMKPKNDTNAWASPLHPLEAYPSIDSKQVFHTDRTTYAPNKEPLSKNYKSPSIEALEENHYDVAVLRPVKVDGNNNTTTHRSLRDQPRASWFQRWPSPNQRSVSSKSDRPPLDTVSYVDASSRRHAVLAFKSNTSPLRAGDSSHHVAHNPTRTRIDKLHHHSGGPSGLSKSTGEGLNAGVGGASAYIGPRDVFPEYAPKPEFVQRQQFIGDSQITTLPTELVSQRHSQPGELRPAAKSGDEVIISAPTTGYGKYHNVAPKGGPQCQSTHEPLPANFVIQSGVPLVQSSEIIRPVAFKPIVPAKSSSSFSDGNQRVEEDGQRTPTDLRSLELALQDLTESANSTSSLEWIRRPTARAPHRPHFDPAGPAVPQSSYHHKWSYGSDNEVDKPRHGYRQPSADANRSPIKYYLSDSDAMVAKAAQFISRSPVAAGPSNAGIQQVRYVGPRAASKPESHSSPSGSIDRASGPYKSAIQFQSSLIHNSSSSSSDYDIPVPSSAISTLERSSIYGQYLHSDSLTSSARYSARSSANSSGSPPYPTLGQVQAGAGPRRSTSGNPPSPEEAQRHKTSRSGHGKGTSQTPPHHFPHIHESHSNQPSVSNPIYSVASTMSSSMLVPASSSLRQASPTRQNTTTANAPSAGLAHVPVPHLPLSGNLSPHGSRHSSSGIQVTPSSSDSGVMDLESILRDKEQELNSLRSTMEQNEHVILRVCQEKEERWQEKLREWSSRLEQSITTEQRLLSQVQTLQDERRQLLSRVEELNGEKAGLQRKCRELESEYFQLKNQFAQRSVQASYCSRCGISTIQGPPQMLNGATRTSPQYQQQSTRQSKQDNSSRSEVGHACGGRNNLQATQNSYELRSAIYGEK